MTSKTQGLRALIIGSGPVGVVTTSLALKQSFNVTMVDIGCFEKELPGNNEIGLKTADGSVHPYDLGQYAKLDFGDLDFKWRTSKGKYGFSTVWGGTWEKLNALNSTEWNDAYSRVRDIINKTSHEYVSECSCAPSIMANSAGSPPLSILVNKDRNNPKVWSTQDLISELSKNINFKYVKGKVVKFVESVKSVNVLIDNGKDYKFDVVYLCCGPVGNAYLILNSKPKPAQIVLRDTQIVYIPFLYRKATKSCQEINNFPTRSALTITKKSKLKCYFQIYPHVTDYREQVLSKVPHLLRSVVNPLFDIIFDRIGIALGYLDQLSSSSIRLVSGSTVLVEELPPKDKISKLSLTISAFLSLKKIGLSPMPMFTKFGSPGDSYHLGMANSIVQPKYGSIDGFNRVYAFGAIALPILEPGPITYSAMAQAVIGFDYSLKKLPKL